jgi:hypothetical protein
VSAAGGLLMLVCFAFLGPAPYLAPFIQPSFHTVCLALVAQGFGCAAVLGTVFFFCTCYDIFYLLSVQYFPFVPVRYFIAIHSTVFCSYYWSA